MAQLSITLLGSFEIICDDQPLTGLATDKVRALIAYLAVESARPQRRDLLADLLWPDMSQNRARHNLRQSLSRLRTALDCVGYADLLSTDGHETVRLNLSGDVRIDAAEAKALIAAIRRHRHRRADLCLPCLQRYARLAQLYQGDFLTDFIVPGCQGFEEWALIQREWLRREAIQALAALGAYHERRGESSAAQQAARRQVRMEPWREEAHRDLMRLLACAGERTAALAQYEACHNTLAAELDVAPTAETTVLAEEIRSGALPQALCPAEQPLPTIPTRFIGRQQELARLADMLADPDCRVITLTGPGGIGKTRLALEVAEHHRGLYRDGVFFVTCESLDDYAAVAPAIVEELGIATSSERPAETILCDYLRHRELLLVLDNVEHVLGCATLLAHMLHASPGLTLLTTSHERLRLREEWVYVIGGLPFPEADETSPEAFDAVALFVARAQQVDRTYSLTPTSAHDVVAICRLVEGASLAIELAANAVVDHGCAAVLAAINEGISPLATPLVNVPDRHRSLQAVCDYSWETLPSADQLRLSALSTFVGGLSAEAASTVVGVSPADLAAWSARSLLRREGSDRYTWHPVMRRYAVARLAANPGLEEATRSQYALYFAGWLAGQTAHFHDAAQQKALAAVAHELENVRAAWRWAVSHGDAPSASQMSDGLYHFHRIRGRFEEGLALLAPAVDRWADDPDRQGLWAHLRARQGALATPLGRYHEAHTALQEALSVSRRLANAVETRFCLLQLTRLIRGDKQAAEITQAAEQALALARADGDHADTARALFLLGQQRLRAGDLQEATAHCTESLAEAETAGDPRLKLVPLNALGDLACHRGAYAEALDIFERCLALSRALGDRFLASIHLNNLGTVYHLLGETTRAEPYYAESLALCRDMGDRSGEAIALSNLGEITLAHSDVTGAQRAFAASLAIGRALGDQGTLAVCMTNLAEIAMAQHRHAAAQDYLSEALRIATESRDWPQAAKSLLNAATLLIRIVEQPLAAAVLSLLSTHPAAEQHTRETAARLRANLPPASLAFPSLEAAVAAVQSALAGPANERMGE